jgi:hypothetical protein
LVIIPPFREDSQGHGDEIYFTANEAEVRGSALRRRDRRMTRGNVDHRQFEQNFTCRELAAGVTAPVRQRKDSRSALVNRALAVTTRAVVRRQLALHLRLADEQIRARRYINARDFF